MSLSQYCSLGTHVSVFVSLSPLKWRLSQSQPSVSVSVSALSALCQCVRLSQSQPSVSVFVCLSLSPLSVCSSVSVCLSLPLQCVRLSQSLSVCSSVSVSTRCQCVRLSQSQPSVSVFVCLSLNPLSVRSSVLALACATLCLLTLLFLESVSHESCLSSPSLTFSSLHSSRLSVCLFVSLFDLSLCLPPPPPPFLSAC